MMRMRSLVVAPKHVVRVATSLALLLVAAPAYAQGYVGGFALDSATNAPLPCLEVSLVDTAGMVIAHQLTSSAGAFQLDAPPKGRYQLRFFAWSHDPLYGPVEDLDPTVQRARKYALTLRPGRELALRAAGDTASTSPIGAPANPNAAQLVYPLHLRERGQEGQVIAHFVVDSTGRVVVPTVQIARSSNSGFTDVVRDYLRKVEFEPARLDRRPVCALVRDWPFRFTLPR